MGSGWAVIGFYGAVAIWAATLVGGLRTRQFKPFLGVGIAIALVLNIGYFVNGQADSIAFFVGIYDVFDNLGLGRTEGADALATCADNACSVWGDRYVNHPSWGVAFFDRFANASALRSNLLYIHIALNSVAFVLMHYLLFRPGTGGNAQRHRMVGRISFGLLTAGTGAAVWLASEHASVSEYGGIWAQLGFYSMSAFVYGTAVLAISKVRRGNPAEHRVWMIRHVGSMWGAFWLFRLMLTITGPVFRGVESASLLISIWGSAPLGIVIAEWARKRYMEKTASLRSGSITEAESAVPAPA